MKETLEDMLEEIHKLESRISEEIEKKKKDLKYRINKHKIIFEKEAISLQKKFSISLPRYMFTGNIIIYIVSPVIYSMIIPALILDLFVSAYQYICLPVYGLPHLKRSDYIVIDRQYLKYINLLERLNCVYCGYFNGLIAYTQEVASISEQYWCPIKHARKLKKHHDRYYQFIDYGNAEDYRKGLNRLRNKLKEEFDIH